MQNSNLTAIAALRNLRQSSQDKDKTTAPNPKPLAIPDHFIVIKNEDWFNSDTSSAHQIATTASRD